MLTLKCKDFSTTLVSRSVNCVMHLPTFRSFFLLDSNKKIQRAVFELYVGFKGLLGGEQKALSLL